MWRCLAFGLSLALCGPAARSAPTLDTASQDFDSRTRFQSYEDNYALFGHWMRNPGWTGNDERAMRAQYSFRYVLVGRSAWDLALSYTGEFDFYMNTRPSGPVINRLSNPALRARYVPRRARTEQGVGSVELSYEHESDGQTTEVAGGREAELAQDAYNRGDRAYFDEISRGSDFVSVGLDLPEGSTGLPVSVRAKLRWYTHQDSAVTWGPLAGRGERLADYHRLRVRIGKQTRLGLIDGQWTLGDGGLRTDSFEIGWQPAPSWNLLPLYVRYHRGPLNTLSNYSQRQDSIGIGLRFGIY